MQIPPFLVSIKFYAKGQQDVLDTMHQDPKRAEDEGHLEGTKYAQFWGYVVLGQKQYFYSINVNTHFDPIF